MEKVRSGYSRIRSSALRKVLRTTSTVSVQGHSHAMSMCELPVGDDGELLQPRPQGLQPSPAPRAAKRRTPPGRRDRARPRRWPAPPPSSCRLAFGAAFFIRMAHQIRREKLHPQQAGIGTRRLAGSINSFARRSITYCRRLASTRSAIRNFCPGTPIRSAGTAAACRRIHARHHGAVGEHRHHHRTPAIGPTGRV
jgi:hypothetical protein